MKNFLQKNRDSILIILPIIIAILTLYTSSLEMRISEIYTSYIIDITTLNNSFVTLAINTASQNNESIQETKSRIDKQMGQFNSKYDGIENELKIKQRLKSLLNIFIFVLLVIQIILVISLPSRKAGVEQHP